MEDPSYEEGILVEISSDSSTCDQQKRDTEWPLICLEDFVNFMRREATPDTPPPRLRKVFVKPSMDSCRRGALIGTFTCYICEIHHPHWEHLVEHCRLRHNGNHPISYRAAEIIAHGLLKYTGAEASDLSLWPDTTSPAL